MASRGSVQSVPPSRPPFVSVTLSIEMLSILPRAPNVLLYRQGRLPVLIRNGLRNHSELALLRSRTTRPIGWKLLWDAGFWPPPVDEISSSVSASISSRRAMRERKRGRLECTLLPATLNWWYTVSRSGRSLRRRNAQRSTESAAGP